MQVLCCDASLHCLNDGTQFSSATVGDETGTVGAQVEDWRWNRANGDPRMDSGDNLSP